jgi:hypothetical protein
MRPVPHLATKNPARQRDDWLIKPICGRDDGERLIESNHNPRREHRSFALNLRARGESPNERSRYVSWDPGGTDDNGGSGEQICREL